VRAVAQIEIALALGAGVEYKQIVFGARFRQAGHEQRSGF